MKVYIKKTEPSAVVPFKTYERDFCYDVTATSCKEIAPNVYEYGIGLAFQIDRDGLSFPQFFGVYDWRKPWSVQSVAVLPCTVDIDFRPRSSVWKTGMVLSNCEGTIDEIYRGEVTAVFYHVFPNMPKYEVGDRIGQIKIGFTVPMEFELVEELDDTERGCDKHGSTGR